MKRRAAKQKSRRVRPTGRKEVVIQETTRITTEPVVEIRKPATLSQALTEPEVAVVRPFLKVVRRTTRRIA